MFGRDLNYPSACVFVAVFLTVAFAGCSRCDDKGDAAIQTVLPHLEDQTVASNLVREATLAIARVSTQAMGEVAYVVPRENAPLSYGLKVEGAVWGNYVLVTRRGESAPYMTIRIPIHFGGPCWWEAYVCIKPGGGFVKNGTEWVLAERPSNTGPVVKFSDEILLCAVKRDS